MGWLFAAALFLTGLLAIQLALLRVEVRRLRVDAASARRHHLSLALHLVGERLREDRSFAALLVSYHRDPDSLPRVDRMRARSWNRSAARVFRLALAESRLGADSVDPPDLSWLLPAMGESPRAGDAERPAIEDLIEMDPEFLALLEASRGRSGRPPRGH